MFRRTRGALFSVLACVICLAVLAPSAGAAPLRVGNFGDALANELFAPNSMPPGSNNWSCKPSSTHPYPVILVHGTLANEAFSWQALSPMLANAGYCVYAFNYGANSSSLGFLYALTDIGSSAGRAAGVREQGAGGHGGHQGRPGGPLPGRHDAPLLHQEPGWRGQGPHAGRPGAVQPWHHRRRPQHPGRRLKILGVPITSTLGCVSCTEQILPSAFMSSLNAGGDTQPGPKYVVIESKYDEIVTPYTSAFLTGPNVQNILLQNQCSIDFIDHIGIGYDPVALQDVMNALGANSPTFRPHCSLVLPVVGG